MGLAESFYFEVLSWRPLVPHVLLLMSDLSVLFRNKLLFILLVFFVTFLVSVLLSHTLSSLTKHIIKTHLKVLIDFGKVDLFS